MITNYKSRCVVRARCCKAIGAKLCERSPNILCSACCSCFHFYANTLLNVGGVWPPVFIVCQPNIMTVGCGYSSRTDSWGCLLYGKNLFSNQIVMISIIVFSLFRYINLFDTAPFFITFRFMTAISIYLNCYSHQVITTNNTTLD